MERRRTLLDTLRRLVLLAAGAFLFAAGVNGFFVPHRLLSTGTGGISMLVNYITGWPIWLLVALINVPVFILGWIYVSRRFFLLSLFGLAAFTLFLWLTEGFDFSVDNALLSAAVGGALCGAGSGLMLRQGGSKGGVDIIAGIMHRFFALSYGTVSNAVNLAIILVMALLFGLESALLTLAEIFILGRVADTLLSGLNPTITVLVVSRRKNNIVDTAAQELGRRASVLQNIEDKKRPKEIMMFIVQPRELSRLKEIIFDQDKNAEVMLINTKEVRVRGFERKGLL